MTIHELNEKIQALRIVINRFQLNALNGELDGIIDYFDQKRRIVSIIGSSSSGKCSLVNALVEKDLLPTKVFKPRVYYRITQGNETGFFETSSGKRIPYDGPASINQYSKNDYDVILKLTTQDGLMANPNLEIRTGFDIDNNCRPLDYLMSDVVVLCAKATSLFSLEEMSVLNNLIKSGHSKIMICITHVNNVNAKDFPEIVRFIESKQLNHPVVFFSDEPIDSVPVAIRNSFGIGQIMLTLMGLLGDGVDYNQRLQISDSVINGIADACVKELVIKKTQKEQEKENKYARYLKTVAQNESVRLGWADIRVGYEKMENACVDSILADLNKAKSKIFDRIQTSILATQNPKEWWEKLFPIMLKNEIDNVSSAIDNKLQSVVIRDFNWINQEIQIRFRQTPITSNTKVNETSVDFTLDPNSLSFNNLRAARYITMAGGATLATIMFFIVGPVGAVVSASCGIIGDRYIHKVIEGQRESLKIASANVIDDVISQMSSMIPARVSVLYEEIAKGIAEKERIWSDTFAIEEFSCDEMRELQRINESMNIIQNLKSYQSGTD